MTSLSFRLLALFFTGFGSPLFVAEAHALSCRDLLSKLSVNAQVDTLFSENFAHQLIDDLKPKVEQIVQVDPVLGESSVEEIYHLYISQRIKNLPEKVQLQVKDVLDSSFRFKIFETDAETPPPFEAYSHRELYMIFLVLPASVHKTAFDYFIRVHELEHIIQYFTVGKRVLSELHPTQHLNLFYFERGAMRSESAFLKLFPPEYLRELLTRWKASPHQMGLADDIFESVTLHTLTSETVGEYVELQWEHGRYSKKVYSQRHLYSHVKFWSTTLALTSPLWLKLLGAF